MGSCLRKADASSSDKLDAESDVSDESVWNEPKTENAGYCMDDELKRMDQLVSDLTAEWDRIKRESVIQCLTGVCVDRSAEFVARANSRMEEAHTVLSGVWMTPGPMDRLPPDRIVHIMHFIPIQQVFVCMSVNKKWQEAARHTIRTHKRVQLVSKHHLRHKKTKIHNPLNLIVWNNWSRNAPEWRRLTKSMLLMEKLSHLETSDCYVMDRKYINPVIVKNAASLQVLDTDGNLPSSQQGPVVYHELKKLDCRLLSQRTECPVLEELTIRPCCALGPVDQLPILTMRKFVCVFDPSLEPDRADFFFCTLHDCDEGKTKVRHAQNLFQAAKRLVHLNHLTIDLGVPVHDVSTLMDNFRSLVHLNLTFPHTDLAFDQKVDQLVRQNPGLRELILCGLSLSDAALTSIARLHDLQHLKLLRGVRFSEEGVLTFLRSRLRPLLTLVTIEMNDDVAEEILDEIALIAAERGKPLIRKVAAGDTFTFEF